MTENIRIVIADDDEEVRAHIRELVGCQKYMQVIAEAGNGDHAVALVKRHLPQLVLLDIEMPGMNRFQALQRISRDYPQTHVMIVSSSTDRASVKEAQKFGARGYVAKQDLEENLALAIQAVMAGGSFLSRAASQGRAGSSTKPRATAATEKAGEARPHGQQSHAANMRASTLGSETGLIRVLVVDDEAAAAQDICEILEDDKKISVVGSCTSVETAMKLIEQLSPNIVLLDLDFWRYERGGWQVVRKNYSGVRVILCTRSTERADVSEAWRKKVDGYIPKSVLQEELIQAIYTVHSGDRHFSPSLGKFGSRCRGILSALSDAERDVFSLFIRDYSAKQIGKELCIEPGTVDSHKFNIRDKIGHQDGWKGVASEARKEEKAREAEQTQKANNTPKYSVLLSRLIEPERKVFDLYVGRWDGRGYVGSKTAAEDIAEALRTPVGEVKALILEIRRKLNCHSNGWKGIAKDEGDID